MLGDDRLRRVHERDELLGRRAHREDGRLPGEVVRRDALGVAQLARYDAQMAVLDPGIEANAVPAATECVPPHDLTGKPAVFPVGPAAEKLIALMNASKPIVAEGAAEVGSIASQIWLWGQGVRPDLPAFAPRYGMDGRLTSAVDLVRGLGVLTGLEVLDVPGATAGFDNDYAAQRDAALASLEDRDFFLLHVEATDEAAHQGEVREKVVALERWDRDIIGPLTEALDGAGTPYRILLMPDHATPCAIKTHTSDPVPYLLFDSTRDAAGGEYTEVGVADSGVVVAHTLMRRLLEA